jgi:hypothetical protein
LAASFWAGSAAAQTGPGASFPTGDEPAPAAAPPAPTVEDVSRGKGPYASVTFSPLHLISPVFELHVEGRVVPHLGLAVIGGIGSTSSAATAAGVDKQKFSFYELGTQVVGYPLQPFDSLQFGAELMWTHVSTETFNGEPVKANAGAVALGPLIGYKLLTKVGFTISVQAGFQYVAVKASASDDAGNSGTAQQTAFIPLLNLDIGWSF